jgi:hypothetical protein
MSFDPRFDSLKGAYDQIRKLVDRSDLIRMEPLDSSMPPERYLITFLCAGIAGLEKNGGPVLLTEKDTTAPGFDWRDYTPRITDVHKVEMYLSANWPNRQPSLLWLTDIWHPNIDAEPPRHVCTNVGETWWANKAISELVLDLGKMAKYEWYFAKDEPPFPENKAAAKWVRDVAEKQGLLAPDKPIDPRSLEKRWRIFQKSAPRFNLGERIAAPTKTRRFVVGNATSNRGPISNTSS